MAHVSTSIFGTFNGQDIISFRIQNPSGTYLEVLNYGCIVHAWGCFNREGKVEDVLLGCMDAGGYTSRHPYFGSIVGRYANRINNGRFRYEEVDYQLSINLQDHHLHGGLKGLDQYFFDYQVVHGEDEVSLIFQTTSPDGDQGYPGNLHLIVIYTFTHDNSLIIRYKATTDKTTPVNLTNHCYFNLSGNQSSDILDHILTINSTEVLEVNNDLIPTGGYFDVVGTPLDLSSPKRISEVMDVKKSEFLRQNGWDHCYVLDKKRDRNEVVATCHHESSGRILTVLTDKHYLQLYTGNWLEGTNGKIAPYKAYSGLCFETQNAPDGVNHPEFGDVFLRPGEEYYSMTMYHVGLMR